MVILPDEELPFDANMLDRLAEVSIRVGLNLQPGQDLIISAPVETLPLVRRLASEAYRNGAGVVTTFLSDDQLPLARFEHATDERLDRAPRLDVRGNGRGLQRQHGQTSGLGSQPPATRQSGPSKRG